MLVQQDPINPNHSKLPTKLPFSPSKSLHFSTKIITIIAVLVTTVAALLFLRNAGDPATFLCFHSQTPQTPTLHFPQIDYDSIIPITDTTTPYSRFRSDQWIVVSVSDYPSDSVKKLLKIKGWQVLAVGNSKTPDDWSLKENENLDLLVEKGHFDHLYKQLPRLFNRFENAEGFLFVQDNTILNYWNLVQADKTKLWITDKVSRSWSSVPYDGDKDWYGKQAEMVKKVVKSMPAHLQVNYKGNTNTHDSTLTVCTSDVFYVPQRLVIDFIDLVNLVEDLEIHQKVAIPMFFLAMDSPLNFDSVFDKMIYKRKPPLNITTSFYSPEVTAVHPLRVSNEQEFIELIRVMAAGDPLLLDLV